MLTSALLTFALSACVIVVAGYFLARNSDLIAERTRLGGLLVGSILLAGATSMPELLVDINAVKMDMPDLAVGDLIGSSIFNLMILALGDLLHKDRHKFFTPYLASHALPAVQSISLTALAGMFIILGPQAENFTIGNLGIGSLALLIGYIFGLRLVYRERSTQLPEQEESPKRESIKKPIIGYLISMTAIALAAPHLAESAGKISELAGLSKSFIGTTLVALSTSLPELVSTIVAVRLKSFDLAIGNIFGSNTFNMILLIPLDLFHSGAILSSVSAHHALTCFAVILITGVAVLGQLYHVEGRRRFIEPDAYLVLTLIFASLFGLYYIQ